MKKLILFGLLSVAMVACSKKNNVIPQELEGKWLLFSVKCFCHFDESFDFSQHSLRFDTEEKRVFISNPDDTYFIHETGDYEFSVSDDNVIYIDKEASFTFDICDYQLTLIKKDNPQIADDELTLIYHKEAVLVLH